MLTISSQYSATFFQTCENLPEQRIWYCVQFRRLCEICLAMPLVGLVACLAIALVFQFEHIQETACKVSLLISNTRSYFWSGWKRAGNQFLMILPYNSPFAGNELVPRLASDGIQTVLWNGKVTYPHFNIYHLFMWFKIM